MKQHLGSLSAFVDSTVFRQNNPVQNPVPSLQNYLDKHGLQGVDVKKIASRQTEKRPGIQKPLDNPSEPILLNRQHLNTFPRETFRTPAFSNSKMSIVKEERHEPESFVPMSYLHSSERGKQPHPKERQIRSQTTPVDHLTKDQSLYQPVKHSKNWNREQSKKYLSEYPLNKRGIKHPGYDSKRRDKFPHKRARKPQQKNNYPKKFLKYPSPKQFRSFKKNRYTTQNMFKVHPPILNILPKGGHTYKLYPPQRPLRQYVGSSIPSRRKRIKSNSLKSQNKSSRRLPNYLRPPPRLVSNYSESEKYPDLQTSYVDNIVVSLDPSEKQDEEFTAKNDVEKTLTKSKIFSHLLDSNFRHHLHNLLSLPKPVTSLRPPFYPTKPPLILTKNNYPKVLNQPKFLRSINGQTSSPKSSSKKRSNSLLKTTQPPFQNAEKLDRKRHRQPRIKERNSRLAFKPPLFHASKTYFKTSKQFLKVPSFGHSILNRSQPIPKEVIPQKRDMKIPESHVSMYKNLRYGVNGKPLDVWIPITTTNSAE